MSLEAIRYVSDGPQNDGKATTKNSLEILDQLLLPDSTVYLDIKSVEDGWNGIRNMNVRGAPAIAIVGCLSLSVEIISRRDELAKMGVNQELKDWVWKQLDYLETSRPTAVNLKRSCSDIKELYSSWKTSAEVLTGIVKYSEDLFRDDVMINRNIGTFGARHILEGKDAGSEINILTHCNTGSLATAGYGTALGVIRALNESGRLTKAYCTETRPYNQGSRLTAYELVYEKIPSCLICDDMAGALMNSKTISAVVVGADRVVRNGDTANKIGTYQLAVLALHHKIPFYVASPTTTIDMRIEDGTGIPIEERKPEELTRCGCERKKNVAAKGIDVWNPAFDVTPANLITGGIITEFGVVQAPLDTKENMSLLKFQE